jgi:hypothetical protein
MAALLVLRSVATAVRFTPSRTLRHRTGGLPGWC